MQQMNTNSYQVVDQAFLSQLKSENVTVGFPEKSRLSATTKTSKTGATRNLVA